MKAIVMAGGEGTRLRPLTSNCPKPMVRLLDRPVLEHILALLKDNGIRDVCITLRYMPEAITDYFGDGSDFGVNISYSIENEPMGTAGGVKKCAGFIGGDDFIVISGDCVCDFDLTECIGLHRSKNALSTIVLYACPEPLEYGLVVAGEDGRIKKFIEKPAWDHVVTDLINTGIYVMSPEALDLIPDGVPYDFGKDFFPDVLSKGERLYGVQADGYWCDIGSVKSYLRCSMDALSGNVRLVLDEDRGNDRLFCLSPVPAGVKLTPPVYVGENAVIGERCELGPGAFIGSGSSIGSGVSVKNSVIDSAALQSGASVTGSVICRGAAIGKNTVVSDNCVIGENTVIGERCVVSENVKIWPEQEIASDTRVNENVTAGAVKSEVSFGAGASVAGEFGVTMTPEIANSLGAAAAGFGKVCAASAGGNASDSLAESFISGARCAGSCTAVLDAAFEAAAAFTGKALGFDITVFFSQNGEEISAVFFDKLGLPLERDAQRKIESALASGAHGCRTDRCGSRVYIHGNNEAYSMASVRSFNAEIAAGRKISVTGHDTENRLLRNVLSQLGYDVVSGQLGVPSFTVAPGGGGLYAFVEDGRELEPDRVFVITAMCALEDGQGDTAAVPYDAPSVLEEIAEQRRGRILRVGRDGVAAKELYSKQTFMHDGIFAAVKICGSMAKSGRSLKELNAMVPDFAFVTKEVFLTGDRASVMRELTSSLSSEMAAEFDCGLKVTSKSGTAYIRPSFNAGSIIVKAEGCDEYRAQRLCTDLENLAKRIGKEKKADALS